MRTIAWDSDDHATDPEYGWVADECQIAAISEDATLTWESQLRHCRRPAPEGVHLDRHMSLARGPKEAF